MATATLSRDTYRCPLAPRGLIPDPLTSLRGGEQEVGGVVVALNVCGVNTI